MSETWNETLQGVVRVIVCCGSVGFVAWVVTNCFLKIMRWHEEE